MKVKTKLRLLSLIQLILGVVLISVYGHWLVAVGVFLIIWGNNLEIGISRSKIL